MEDNNKNKKQRMQKININGEDIWVFDDMDINVLLNAEKEQFLAAKRRLEVYVEEIEKIKDPKFADYLRSLPFEEIIHYYWKKGINYLEPNFSAAIMDLLGIDIDEYHKRLIGVKMFDIDELICDDFDKIMKGRKK